MTRPGNHPLIIHRHGRHGFEDSPGAPRHSAFSNVLEQLQELQVGKPGATGKSPEIPGGFHGKIIEVNGRIPWKFEHAMFDDTGGILVFFLCVIDS